ncbi:biotin-dependent carboxyltransferase family protein [Roseovarius sp.]|uniref:5-oxoprolinase subunit C family protein n=1 Tax=Roseovarius sp. TaxID=1486281 RepID=UPI00262CC0FE|nr:biotin-dependent carboxyltransferase family protein [Roseovarius sp.]
MSAAILVRRAGPAMTIQDLGRPGQLVYGLAAGGAADRVALAEGAALLGQGLGLAAIEMAGMGGEFEATRDIRIALTGAPMKAELDGAALVWNASHFMAAGQRLTIGAASGGNYGYLHVGGGIDTKPFLGSRAAHLTGGIGKPIQSGDHLPVGTDPHLDNTGNVLTPQDRFSGGTVTVLPSVHTCHFPEDVRMRFEATAFERTPRGNRQGAELAFDGAPFSTGEQLTILSECMTVGDIQMTGNGQPFVLLPECQTVGGYPRIGTVTPDDLPKVAQATPGTILTFEFITHEQAVAAHRSIETIRADMARLVHPLIRDPHRMQDLLSYQLISGAITGWDDTEE